jgi:bifunctional non-homologous end joining protein LigD
MRPLAEYTRKRNFKITPEPGAKVKRSAAKKLIFVVQEHHASHLHYDFRLEWDGVLKSWAVPKGPSMDPSQRRLAVEVEDHPIEYAKFTGKIPKGEYGAGDVYRWDMGTWNPLNDVDEGLKKGRLEFELKGKKLKGEFLLVRTRTQGRKPNWLLFKRHDRAVATPSKSKRPAKKDAEDEHHAELIPPQLAELVDQPPAGDDWIHEIKFDGYRIQAHVRSGKVTMLTRKGLDWVSKYSAIEKALKKLKVESAILDGEIVWQDRRGHSNFQGLQNAMKHGHSESLIYWVFDLLELNGEDYRGLPLMARKERLQKLIEKLKHPQVRFSDHYRGMGEELIAQSCKLDLEGIVSKRVDAIYTSGRGDLWVKSKCIKRQEFVIGGYTEGTGERVGFGSLLLGVYDGGQLRFVGRVGTGFDQSLLREIKAKLRKLEIEETPFEISSPRGRGHHWVKPKLVAEVAFSQWTKDQQLRVPVFQGLRLDKSPKQIVHEVPKHVEGNRVQKIKAGKKNEDLKITHPDRVIYPKEGLTKRDIADYYQRVSRWMVPQISDRPISLVRCPESATKPCFFSKHFVARLPEHLIAVPEKGNQPWVAINSAEGLRTLAQWGVLEIHPWNAHRQTIETPDQIVMDFDPDPSVEFELVKGAAFDLRELLEQIGIRSFVKTTGGKGLHVQFPFEPKYDWDSVKAFSKTLVQEMVSRDPDLFTGNLSKQARKGKIFIDYLRNGRGSTAVAPYSLRAREISAVAMPISWKELETLKASNVFTLKKALEHLKGRRTDPWRDYFSTHQKIALLS